jgi:hypothetical protein
MVLRGFIKIVYGETSGRKWYRHHVRGIKLDNDSFYTEMCRTRKNFERRSKNGLSHRRFL